VLNYQIVSKYFLFIGLLSFSLSAQLLPPIQSYFPEDYNAANQNWMITQSKDKEMFFANNDGLLTFNGSRWNMFLSNNGTIIRSVKSIDNRIYSGSYQDFGYWEKTNTGIYTYTSLVKKFELIVGSDEEFWDVLEYDDWIIFQSLSRLIMYNNSSQKFEFFDPSEEIYNSFVVDNKLYFTLKSGLYTFENGKKVLLSNDPRLLNVGQSPHIVNAFKNNDNLLLISDNLDFFELYPTGRLIPWNISSDFLNKETIVYSAIRLNDNGFAIGTVGQGIILLNDKGSYISTINKSTGINNNTVLSVFEDVNSNIWLGLDNGISVINIKSPFNIFNDFKGLLGTVYASKYFKDFLYIGTNQGLYYKKNNSKKSFKLIENTTGQVWNLSIIQDQLFCGHNEGAFQIIGDRAIKIDRTAGSWSFRQIPNFSNLILEGSYYGFNVLEKVKDKWQVRNNIEGFENSSRLFEIADNNKVIVSHGYKGVYTLSFSKDFSELKDVKIDTSVSVGGNVSLGKFDGDIYYNYDKGFYKYNVKKNYFEKDTLLSELSSKELINSTIINDDDKKLWMFSKNYMHYMYKDFVSNERKIKSILFSEKLRKSIFENISKTIKEHYIIGTNYGYVDFNLDQYELNSPEIQIEKIEVSQINNPPSEVDSNDDIQLEYKFNNLNFFYNTRNFQKFQDVNYQYALEGYLDGWSPLSEKAQVNFSNLKPGDYEFKVRAFIGNLVSSDIKTFKFSIEPSWYWSNFMITNYILALGILIFLVNRSYIKYYRKKEEKIIRINQNKLELKEIEKKQALMSIENNKLQDDIEGKNRELAISTMSMIKKNQFLSKIKLDLKQIESNQKIFSVIKMIDRNLNNTDDWKFFEEAFNNADKDFLKKVKETHPSLTNNDLRLCAYLRLNLSSKDISPLLNISLSSVEIKRYRLRKKMNLAHNEGLTDHLLSL
jgi:DNA-binding CsgD family transcriptional regulator|tara:strand:- start:1725 stop:4538 length:2814 start_codon:yes stop_codon:yes gene_type:complete